MIGLLAADSRYRRAEQPTARSSPEMAEWRVGPGPPRLWVLAHGALPLRAVRIFARSRQFAAEEGAVYRDHLPVLRDDE